MTRPLWQVVTGLGITQIIGWGTTYYALGAVSPAIAAATGWSSTLVFGAFSVSLLLSSLISSHCGHLVDRWGGRHAMALGSLLATFGCLLMGAIAAPWAYVLGWLVLAPAMRLATYDAAFASLSQIAGQKSRISISYLTLFGGLASTAFWPLGHALASRFGWQATFLIYAGLNFAVCLPLHLMLLQGPASGRAHSPEATTANLTGHQRTVALAAFSVVLAFNGLVFAAISAHVLPLFTGLGLAAAEAVTLAALIGPSQVGSRALEIVVGRFWSPGVLALIAFGLLPFAILAAMAGHFTLATVAVFVVLYGASNGLVTIAKGTYPLSLFGPADYGRTLGIISAPSLVLNALSPLGMAWLLGQFGAPAAMGVGLLSGLVSATLMAWLFLRYRSR